MSPDYPTNTSICIQKMQKNRTSYRRTGRRQRNSKKSYTTGERFVKSRSKWELHIQLIVWHKRKSEAHAQSNGTFATQGEVLRTEEFDGFTIKDGSRDTV